MYSVQLSGEGGHPVIGIRRTAPTRSEVHADFTVWYLLEGAGTSGHWWYAGRRRRDCSRGNSRTQHRRRRDQADPRRRLRYRAGWVPHWVSQVEAGELLYLVVKVTK